MTLFDLEIKHRINCEIKASVLDGFGVFAKYDIGSHERIEVPDNTERCFINHSETPNSFRSIRYESRANTTIKEGTEITEDYNLIPKCDRPKFRS